MTIEGDDTHKVIKNPSDMTFYIIHVATLVKMHNGETSDPIWNNYLLYAVKKTIVALIQLTHDGFDKPLYLLKLLSDLDYKNELYEYQIRVELKAIEKEKRLEREDDPENHVFFDGSFDAPCRQILHDPEIMNWSITDNLQVKKVLTSLQHIARIDTKKTIYFLSILSDNYEHEIKRCIGEP